MSALLALVPRWVWAALVAALAATSCKLKYDKDGLTIEVEKARTVIAQNAAAYEGERTRAAQALAVLTNEHRARETALRKAVELTEGERDAQVAAQRVAADELRRRLRAITAEAARADAANVPAAATAPAVEAFAAGSVGAFLRDHAPDVAQRFVDEAVRAEVIRAELMKCYADYDAAARALRPAGD